MFDIQEQRLCYWTQLKAELQTGAEGDTVAEVLQQLYSLERYWAFPGLMVLEKIDALYQQHQLQRAINLVENTLNALSRPRKKAFIPFSSHLDQLQRPGLVESESHHNEQTKPCFEVLVIHPDPIHYYALYNNALLGMQSDRDEFLYELVFASNIADAVTALLNNPNIQACIALSGCVLQSDLDKANQSLSMFNIMEMVDEYQDSALAFREVARQIRPQIEHYYIAQLPFAELPALYFNLFHQVFYHEYPFKDLHYHLLNAIRDRYNTPFLNALLAYAKKPRSVFHALPISQGLSIRDSVWASDFYQLYGHHILNVETSGTQGGLDSLLNPKGAIKSAQEKAATAFGAEQTFFVTNGTSTSNKIVMQANLRPGDIVFISSDCHKSIPYGVILAGAQVHFLQTNAVERYDLYGAIPLQQIIEKMHQLQQQGLLSRLKQIVLTNSTFDGLIYDVEHYMMAILAMKPDIIFHWDEAWHAHAHFNALYQRRHAMGVARVLRHRFNSETYRAQYQAAENPAQMPDPDKVKLRVYATQSTHKTLSAFRQGSMIHVYDEVFNEDAFLDAYYTHTSTSPNYQILASLDVARRQMAFEGYAVTQKIIQLAMQLRDKVQQDSDINQVFSVLDERDIYPLEQDKQPPLMADVSSIDLLANHRLAGMRIDPTKVTLDIRKTGLTGGQFRKLLIDRYNIQVNKTSRYTVLFIINIGATQKSIDYLVKVLVEVAQRLVQIKQPSQDSSAIAGISMPQLRRYHSRYQLRHSHGQIADTANLRAAYYDAYDQNQIDYLVLSTDNIELAKSGKNWVSAAFVTPYPPGFPLLVPGQIIDYHALMYLSCIVDDEIHGFHKARGLKIFTSAFLQDEL